MTINMLTDLHTHHAERHRDALVSVSPGMLRRLRDEFPEALFSAGIHPWDTDRVTPADITMLDEAAADPRVPAIGETGLDSLRGAPIERQAELFKHHIELSEATGKPLVIHCVKAWDLLLRIHKETTPGQPWAIHGFRGNPVLARQLTDRGISISLGQHFNPATAASIPAGMLLAETDEATDTISDIIERINLARPDGYTRRMAATNLARFLNRPI